MINLCKYCRSYRRVKNGYVHGKERCVRITERYIKEGDLGEKYSNEKSA